MVWEYVLVFVLAAIPWIEIAAVIPLAIIKGLHPFWVAVLSFTGNFITVLLFVLLFDRFKKWRERKREKSQEKTSSRSERARKIWNKYGLPGLALAAPLLIGTHIAAGIGMFLGAKKQWTTIWMTISLALWSSILAIGSYYGLGFIDFIR
ncbi:small multi-drug export protein (plasmid) [Bacillus sp. 31A1R]|uniref:Small multi-drug export protein n=1 Tax=Robertmurraya mangrovi TaxID=3098077 RepID=A0ABU5IUB5_9BACI|nr:small multi-drug export protein [Bacillus sp. 31A1R]MDZ5470736.1 small multi-drug export protein [Bacillus sp. 31A1R]